MKYAVDKIEENLILCEELTTKEKIVINKTSLTGEVHEGTIIVKVNNSYVIDNEQELERKKIIQEKLNRLKNLKSKD